MALSIPRFVSVEVIKPLLTVPRQRTVVTVTRVKAVVDVAVKAVVAVKPWTGANEDPTVEPVGAVVSVGGAVIGSVIEVSIGANRWHSNADTDGNLGRGGGGAE
jgi:hypothetical protein